MTTAEMAGEFAGTFPGKFSAKMTCAMLIALVLGGPIGCDRKEINDLKSQVTRLETELAESRAKLAQASQEVQALRAQGEQDQSNVEDLVKVKVERDQLKQELAAIKKRR